MGYKGQLQEYVWECFWKNDGGWESRERRV